MCEIFRRSSIEDQLRAYLANPNFAPKLAEQQARIIEERKARFRANSGFDQYLTAVAYLLKLENSPGERLRRMEKGNQPKPKLPRRRG